jgi:molybdopterin molybdotransferase
LKSGALLPLETALEQILAHAPAPPPTERLSSARSLLRILAQDLDAQLNVPPQDNSAMDGYALRSVDAGQVLRVSQRVAAGDVPEPLARGTAARIFTGALLPEGADAVVMQEDCEVGDSGVRVPVHVASGQHVRRRGQDCHRGDTLLQAGRLLRPQDMGLLASQGLLELSVYRPLRVALLCTGNELREVGSGALGPGEIYNSNRPMLMAMLGALGCEVLDLGIVPDTAEATADALRRAAADADVIISCGGVSVGEADYVRGEVAKLGEITLWRIAIKPGKPFAFGRVGQVPFLGLPGNPSSAFVTFLLLARPFLCAAQGRRESAPFRLQGVAGFAVERPATRTDYQRVQLEQVGAELIARPYRNQSSGILHSLTASHALAVIPAGSTLLEGDAVELLLLDSLLF